MGAYEDFMRGQHQERQAQGQQIRLQQAQTEYFERQNRDYMAQLAQGSTQRNWDGLENVSQQQFRPQYQGQGSQVAGLAGAALLGYIAARNADRAQQPVQQAPAVRRPKGWKEPVWGWYIAAAIIVHVLLAFVSPSPAVFWLGFGSLVWVPTWIAIFVHQGSIGRHNEKLAQSQD